MQEKEDGTYVQMRSIKEHNGRKSRRHRKREKGAHAVRREGGCFAEYECLALMLQIRHRHGKEFV